MFSFCSASGWRRRIEETWTTFLWKLQNNNWADIGYGFKSRKWYIFFKTFYFLYALFLMSVLHHCYLVLQDRTREKLSVNHLGSQIFSLRIDICISLFIAVRWRHCVVRRQGTAVVHFFQNYLDKQWLTSLAAVHSTPKINFFSQFLNFYRTHFFIDQNFFCFWQLISTNVRKWWLMFSKLNPLNRQS